MQNFGTFGDMNIKKIPKIAFQALKSRGKAERCVLLC